VSGGTAAAGIIPRVPKQEKSTLELGKRASAEDRWRQVCDIAIKLFLEHGYDNTPMSLIAKEAGLTKAGIYHHFESKQHLLHAVHKHLLEERLLPIVHKSRGIVDPEQRLRSFITDLTLLLTSDFAARILINESRGLSPEQFRDISRVWDEELHLVRDAIAQLQAAGRVRKDLNPTFSAFGAIGMCSWVLYWFDSRRPESAPEVARTFAATFLDGLLQRPQ
jgi:AcrR family transcriptional regulator